MRLVALPLAFPPTDLSGAREVCDLSALISQSTSNKGFLIGVAGTNHWFGFSGLVGLITPDLGKEVRDYIMDFLVNWLVEVESSHANKKTTGFIPVVIYSKSMVCKGLFMRVWGGVVY